MIACTKSPNVTTLSDMTNDETRMALHSIFPEARFYIADDESEIYTVFNNRRQKIGYAFYANGWGYVGEIILVVGLQDKNTIKGIYVISHNETPSYWRLLVSGSFLYQWEGLKIEKCYTNDWAGNGGKVDIVTGATKSAQAIIDAVRETAEEKVTYIK